MPLRTLIIVLLAITALAGCGRRGGLEAPGAPATAVPTAGVVSPLDPGAPAIVPEPEPESAPPRRFFLDFLL